MDLPTTNHAGASSPVRIPRVLALSLALLAMPAMAACGGDGDGESGEPGEESAASQSMPGSGAQGSPAMQEYRQLAQELDSIRQQAMEDSALQAQQADLRSAIQARMEEDPQTQALVSRFDSARTAFQDAQASGDSAAMRKLMPQLQRLQMQLQQAQGQVTEDPEIAAQIDSFREDLQSEMEAIDPEAPEMMERADSLVQQLRQEMSTAADSAAAAGDTGGGR